MILRAMLAGNSVQPCQIGRGVETRQRTAPGPSGCGWAMGQSPEFVFYRRVSHMPRSVQYVYRSQNLLKLNIQCQRAIPKENTKNRPPSLTFSKIPRTWSFHVVVLQRTAKKCTKNYNARAQLLFCSLNLLFCGVLVAVAVVVCLRSFVIKHDGHLRMRWKCNKTRGTGKCFYISWVFSNARRVLSQCNNTRWP